MIQLLSKFVVTNTLIASVLLSAACSLTESRNTVAEQDRQTDTPDVAQVLAPSVTPEPSAEIAQAIELAVTEAELSPVPSEIWELIRSDMQLTALEHPRIDTHIRWFKKHPDYITRVFERSEPYLAWINQQVTARSMPSEITLLPVVESGFNPFAYSHGRAAGLWQFIPGTGKHFGLKQNWWYDGRRDVVAATDAALNYLQQLHKRFDGDWLLALAAYNAGAGNVNKAIRKNKRKSKPTDFWSLDLPRETKAYVPKLIALGKVIQDPAKYNLSLPVITTDIQLATVNTGGQIDLALAADMAGLSLDTLYRYNPGYNRWATAPDGPHYLAVPTSTVESLQTALDDLPPEQRVQWVRHKIKPGQTLIHIARDFHTTVTVLKDVNGLSNHSIQAGKYLLIPKASKDLSEYSLSAMQREKQRLASKGKGIKNYHVVQTGDTLWDIAKLHKVSVRSLAKWNGLAPGDTLRLGKQLVIWSKSSKSANPGQQLQKIHYTVRKGDSLARISHKFRVSLNDLKRWNQLSGKKYLQPGQKLTLYIDVTRQS